MKSRSVHFSSESNEWSTPEELFQLLDQYFCFNLDPCCTHKTAKCKRHFTVKEDGLKQEWDGRVFVNPPYSGGIGKWVQKAYQSSLGGALVVLLLPVRTDTSWWHDYCCKGKVEFFRGRVRFNNGIRNNAAPFPSCLVAFGLPYDCTWLAQFMREWNERKIKKNDLSEVLSRLYTGKNP